MEAAAHGNLTEVKYLLGKGTEIDITDKNGITAFMLASGEGYKEIVEFLLAQGADVNATNSNGETALDITSNEEMKELLRRYNQPRVSADLCYAARLGDLPAIKTSLARGIDVNAKENEGLTALIEASQEGRKDVVEFLLSRGLRSISRIVTATMLYQSLLNRNTGTLWSCCAGTPQLQNELPQKKFPVMK